jgi:hypothetical protein
MSVIDFAKAHPVAVGGGLLAAVVVVVMVLNAGGGGAATVTASPQGDASTGAALQAAQLSAQVRGQEISATAAMKESDNFTALAIAELQALISGRSIDAQREIAGLQIAADQATTINGQTLAAQVANKQTDAQVENARAMYGTINAQTAALVKQSEIAAQPKGLFSWLFG